MAADEAFQGGQQPVAQIGDTGGAGGQIGAVKRAFAKVGPPVQLKLYPRQVVTVMADDEAAEKRIVKDNVVGCFGELPP